MTLFIEGGLMAATAVPDTTRGVSQALQRARTEPAYGAFLLLRVGFTVLPILMGLDKFANLMTNWEHYLAPWIVNLLPFSAHTAMLIVGVIEVIAGGSCRDQAALRGIHGGALACRHHHQPAHLLRLLRRRAA